MSTRTTTRPVRRTLLALATLAMLTVPTPASAVPIADSGDQVTLSTDAQLVLYWLGVPSEVVSVTGGPGGIISGL